MTIRDERPSDIESIRRVNVAAFGRPAEGDLVDALRSQAVPIISLVAEDGGDVVGHVLLSPVIVVGAASAPSLLGLAPMAVTPARQRQGIGSGLVQEGLERCRRTNVGAVVVLGHAEYYPRFGFVSASRYSLRCEYDVPDEVFMVRELRDGALKDVAGVIRYHPLFANV
ncbi:MAG TPA: N-acetyltransferase [Vicinamibacterales bacterium]|jgi:putative acetyltransferase